MTCRLCGKELRSRRKPSRPWSGLCRSCSSKESNRRSIRKAAAAIRKYNWTPELDERLRRAYAAQNQAALTENITALAKQAGWPRSAISMRASRLGITRAKRENWTPRELAYLQEHAGMVSVAVMAKALGRGYVATSVMCRRRELYARVSDGYSMEQATEVLGVARKTVKKWIDERVITLRTERISEAEMTRFLKNYPDLYDLRRVDQAWFKGMIFNHSFGKGARGGHLALVEQTA